MPAQPVLIGGEWRSSVGTTLFHAVDPQTREHLPDAYPISPWSEIDECLRYAAAAAAAVQGWPGERFARFLDRYADLIEQRASELVMLAHRETGLPVQPRLKDAELPRTTNQLRQAAAAAREGSWVEATIDSKVNIRSQREPIGPVAVFGPNNFPFAFNSIAGGDFAAAVAAGNPVIAKAHSSHPGTTRLFAEAALRAAQETDLPPGFVQMLYRTNHADGCRLVADSRLGAVGYTGSRAAGLALKAAADAVGKPIYLELSSINPVVLLPGAIAERRAELAEQFTSSCLMGAGQFCTNPGLVLAVSGEDTEALLAEVGQKFAAAPVAPLLSAGVLQHLTAGIGTLIAHGAVLVAGGQPGGGTGFCHQNTLLRVSGKAFLQHPRELQTEAFGNASLWVIADSFDELLQVLTELEGNLTGSIYSANDGRDDSLYERAAAVLRPKVGRLLNDKMPTGVAVVPAMNHGGPFPATGHPGFTAVGIPAALRRFTRLACYDNVRLARLPRTLQNANPTGAMWRLIDGHWTQGDVPAA
uniref:Aldehyde dehydrogenase (NADP(+)) n=1 Tax=Schlesneria paludicola TaxID=360056 RepID=A0A7C4LJJ1_9PLAN